MCHSTKTIWSCNCGYAEFAIQRCPPMLARYASMQPGSPRPAECENLVEGPEQRRRRRCYNCHQFWVDTLKKQCDEAWEQIGNLAGAPMDPAAAGVVAVAKEEFTVQYDRVLEVMLGLNELGFKDVYREFPDWGKVQMGRAVQQLQQTLGRAL